MTTIFYSNFYLNLMVIQIHFYIEIVIYFFVLLLHSKTNNSNFSQQNFYCIRYFAEVCNELAWSIPRLSTKGNTYIGCLHMQWRTVLY